MDLRDIKVNKKYTLFFCELYVNKHMYTHDWKTLLRCDVLYYIKKKKNDC